MDATEITKAIESDDSFGMSCIVYGLRVDRAIYAAGDTMPASRRWEDCEVTSDVLDGTCAIEVSEESPQAAIAKMKQYHGMGDTVYLIKSRNAKFGEDIGEVVMADAVVVAVVGNV